MYIIDYLNQYKLEFINIGVNYIQKKFLQESFIRWYMLCKKIGIDETFPAENIFSSSYSADISYANKTKYTNFDIFYVHKRTKELYKKYYELFISTAFAEYDNNVNGQWTQINKTITKDQYSRLKDLYFAININETKNFKRDYENLIRLYQFIEIDNTTHLSIPPIFIGVELFGSCINTHNDEFCSLFQVEKKFGSLGSFWDYSFHKSDIYLCNPPFDINLIKKMADKLIQNLRMTEHEVIIVITLPLWDSESQKRIGAKDYKMKFEGYDILINNEFLREKIILDKNIYKYWDYCSESTLGVSNTHLIILSNMNHIDYKQMFDLEKFTKAWRNFSISF